MRYLPAAAVVLVLLFGGPLQQTPSPSSRLELQSLPTSQECSASPAAIST
jgi:hypothetical protein